MIKENYTFPTKQNIELEVKREKDMSLYREGYRPLKTFSKFRTKNFRTKKLRFRTYKVTNEFWFEVFVFYVDK